VWKDSGHRRADAHRPRAAPRGQCRLPSHGPQSHSHRPLYFKRTGSNTPRWRVFGWGHMVGVQNNKRTNFS
jgi:hypothetical protein